MKNETERDKLFLNNEELDGLKAKGFVVTDSIYGKGETNYRLYGAPPFQDTEKDGLTLSLGPFPVDKKHYEFLVNKLDDSEDVDLETQLAILFTPIKIQYEIYGGCDSSWDSKISQNLLEDISLFLTNFYNLTNPVKTECFYWIMPKEDAAQKFYLISGIPKNKQIEKWWDIRIQMRDSSTEKEYDIKTDDYFLVPLIWQEWDEYLPYRLSIPFIEMFSIGNKNGRFIRVLEKEFKDKLLKFINREANKGKSCLDPDKELLCKKLYEENDIKYPTTNEKIFDFFLELKFIKRKFIKGENYIYLNKNLKEPSKIIKLSDNWKLLNNQYKSTKSIVLNYVSLEEYIMITTRK